MVYSVNVPSAKWNAWQYRWNKWRLISVFCFVALCNQSFVYVSNTFGAKRCYECEALGSIGGFAGFARTYLGFNGEGDKSEPESSDDSSTTVRHFLEFLHYGHALHELWKTLSYLRASVLLVATFKTNSVHPILGVYKKSKGSCNLVKTWRDSALCWAWAMCESEPATLILWLTHAQQLMWGSLLIVSRCEESFQGVIARVYICIAVSGLE